MKPNLLLLRDLAACTTGANVHRAKNLEYAYKGFCRLTVRGKSPRVRQQAARQALRMEEEIQAFVAGSKEPRHGARRLRSTVSSAKG